MKTVKKTKSKRGGNKGKGVPKPATSKRASKAVLEAHFTKHTADKAPKVSKGADEEW